MYWLILIASIALIIFICVVLDAHPIVGLFIYLYCSIGIIIGSTGLPKIYRVSPEGAIRKEFAPLPWITRSVDGVKFRPHLDSTYVLNPSGREIVIGKVLYADARLAGTPIPGYEVVTDTVSNTLLSFWTPRTAAFREAPKELVTGLVRGIETVQVLALPTQDLESFRENRYRLLKEASDLDYVVL